MFKTIKLSIFAIVICSCIFSIPAALADITAKPSDEQIPVQDLQRLATVINNIKLYYYKKVDNKTLFDNAISGMLSKLDPHSDYLGPDELRDLKMATFGKFGGIGVEVFPEHGLIKIISPLDDTPASRAGIKAGDYIIKINDKLVRDLTLREAINMMRGPKGSNVTLTILRKGNEKPLVFKLPREIIKIKTIKSKFLKPGYAYVRISVFQEPTADDLAKAIEKLRSESNGNIKGLILDLRNNPGGLLESSIQVADNFLDASQLKKNDLIVYTKGQYKDHQIIANATTGELLPNVPIVILINEGTASAAEIVAGALQDHKRAIVVGTRSFGKGSVQTLMPIDNNSAIKLTTALYYTPLGRSIQAEGIKPDITVSELQIPKPKDGDLQDFPRIDESSLVDHIQNGNKKPATASENELSPDEETIGAANKKEISAEDSSLAYKDYQLFEALQILQGLNAAKGER